MHFSYDVQLIALPLVLCYCKFFNDLFVCLAPFAAQNYQCTPGCLSLSFSGMWLSFWAFAFGVIQLVLFYMAGYRYHQLPIAEDDQYKTGFIYYYGSFDRRIMSMGI